MRRVFDGRRFKTLWSFKTDIVYHNHGRCSERTRVNVKKSIGYRALRPDKLAYCAFADDLMICAEEESQLN